MGRLTHKHDVFDYVLPEQNIVGDNQATEISLGETEYTCKKYIIGEAINKLGELEDILESWHIENLEESKTRLHDCQVYHLENNSNETLIHNLKNELAELKQKAIVPKFERQSHIYGFAYGRVKPYVVIAYLDNTIILCENVESNTFEFCNNYYLVATKEEAEQKLAEIKGE